MLRRSTRLRAAAALAATTVVASLLTTVPAQANPAGTGLVISEVYLDGGSAEAVYANKFVELYNPTGAPISLGGMSLQYRAASPTSQFTAATLSGTVPAAGYYLIQGPSNGANGGPLPTPDARTTLNPSGTDGAFALVAGPTPLTNVDGSVTGNPAVIDLVGWGAEAESFETAPVLPDTNSVTLSLNRTDGVDTDDNESDFTGAAPSPTHSGCTDPDPDPQPASIAEIQGTGDISPLVCEGAVTSGVVTAAYPTGGFNGFYLQTGGSGGPPANDPTPGASDGIFVFGSAAAGAVSIGDSVQVTGTVSEFNGLTEITPAAATDVLPIAALPQVKTTEVDVPPTAAGREALEGMLLHPPGRYTVTDNFSVNGFGSFALALGETPLYVPTEVAAPQSPEAAAVVAGNAARKVVLDDGSSINFTGAQTNKAIPLPWLTDLGSIRVGAGVTFTRDVILDYRFNGWNFQPVEQLTAGDINGVRPVTFRGGERPAAPEPVGGDIQLGTFNVLNYFSTTGAAFEANTKIDCDSFNDRVGNPITVDSCTGDAGPRGAWDDANLARQQVKIVRAINTLGADVVSLEEIENSAKFGIDRDTALATLVAALNAGAGAGTWDYVRSPAAANLPPLDEQDVIRTAFIFKPAAVTPTGASVVLTGNAAFANAREPLAQTFTPVDGRASDRFVMIANHFKSKSSGVDDGTGQGLANPDRIAQAEALLAFAGHVGTAAGTDRVFLAGDFNAYSQETPVQRFKDAGYVDLETQFTTKETYSFGGEIGSLDHVYASPAAAASVTGLDVWQINSPESIAYEYSRYNYNATSFYLPDPFRASDHDPVVIGVDVSEPPVESITLAVNVTLVVKAGKTSAHLIGLVWAGPGVPVSGTMTAQLNGAQVGAGPVTNGFASFYLAPFASRGLKLLTVTYTGSDSVQPSTTFVPIWVR